MKKILTLIMVAVLFANTVMFAAAAETEIDSYNETTDILESLSIYLPSDNMDSTQDYVTREGMAQILSVFLGHNRTGNITEFGGESYYSDVDATRPSAYEIMFITGTGIMSGYLDGTFRPEVNVRYIEALKTSIVLLGYDILAQREGGWPNGYKNIAVQLGLMEGISLFDEEYLTKGDFTKLLWNALNTEVLQSDASFNMQRGELLLNTMDIYELKGTFTATDQTALFGYENSPLNYIQIGSSLVYTEQDYNSFLGRNVKAYYEYTEDGETVLKYLATDKARNELVVVPAKYISDKTTVSRFVYFDDNMKEKSVSIESNTSVIFNGRRLTYFGLEHLIPKVGTVTLIDAGNASMTIFIESYVDYFVSSVYNDGTTLTVAERNGKAPVTLELQYANKNIRVLKGTEILSTDVLKQNMLISLAADKMESDGAGGLKVSGDATAYTMLVGGKTIVGTFASIDKETFSATVYDTEYAISKAIDLQKNHLSLGKIAVIYLNGFEEIAKIRYLAPGETISYVSESFETKTAQYTGGEGYGFIVDAIKGKGLVDEAYVRVFTQEGEFVNLTATARTQLDGATYKNALSTTFLEKLQKARDEFITQTKLDVSNTSGFEQLVRYSLATDGTLKSIDTIMPNYEVNSAAEQDCFQFGMRMTNSDVSIPGVVENQGLEGLAVDKRIDGYSVARNFEGIVGLVKNGVAFSIPYDLGAEKAFSIVDLFSIKEKRTPILFFDLDDFQMAKAALMQGVSSGGTLRHIANNMMLVEKKLKTADEDGEILDALSGYQLLTGKKVTVLVSEELAEKVAQIDKGDIIRWNENNYGQANLIDITCTYDYEYAETLTSTKGTSSFNAAYRFVYGTVQNISDERILMKYEGQYFPETYPLEYLKTIYHVDMQNMRITKGNVSMIKSIADFGEGNASKVYMYHDNSKPVAMVIFN